MNSVISFSYPWWLIIFCLALGALYSWVLYRGDRSFDDKTSLSGYYKWAMAAFRFLAVSMLAILLLSPFVRTRDTQSNKPIVAILQDNSESIRNSFKSGDSATYFQKLALLKDKLSAKYEVVSYSIGNELKKNDAYRLSDKVTNISDAVDQLNDIYYNRNLGAAIIASDGIYNQGVNPVYSAAKSPYNIYTIALGDTTVPKDLKFGNVYYNKITYLNDQFAMRADVEATHLEGKSAVLTVTELGGGPAKTIATKNFNIGSAGYLQTMDFVVPATKAGIAHYQLSLTQLAGEVTYRNNVKDIYVEVLDGRQKILLVANSPHPDIAAMKASIESNKNYQLDVIYANDYTGKLNDYNLIILHQLPSANNKIENILQQAKDLKKSLLFVIGSQTASQDLSKVQSCLSVAGSPNRYNDVTAKMAKGFNLFTITETTQLAVSKLPPLENFFGEYKTGTAAQVLMTQKINSVETDYPLWLFADQLDSKVGVIAGEGLWRWRLYDYLQNKNQEAFDELINKTIQYLAVKGDKRPFKVNLAKNIYQDNENISLDAQLYNANYELINTPDVDLKIKSDDGKEYPFKFNKTDNYYTLNAGFLPVGNYSYTATTAISPNTYKAEGRFSVSPLQLEELRTVADHKVMNQLASQHGGQMYHANDFEKIADELLNKNQLKPILYDSFRTEGAINLKWIFFLILTLLTAEWFMRKYLGGY